jgi:glycosyltransferase involved in cell wall biosynthesis
MTAARQAETTVSVFMSNYNHAPFLRKALDALLLQSVQPGRIYLVDDASTDDSAALIREYAARHPEIIVPNFLSENRGCIENINTWLAADKSEFIFIAAADDMVFPTLFEESLALLRRFPRAAVCSALSRFMDRHGTDLGRFQSWNPLSEPGYIFPEEAGRFLETHDSWFMGTTTVFRGSALRSVGFDPVLGGFADGFACRVLALRDGACFIPKELACWRRMRTGMAAQDVAVPSSVHRIANRATALMRGTFRHLFSERHVKRWNCRWMFWAVVAAYDLPRAERRSSLREFIAPLPARQRISLQAFSELAFRPLRLVAKIAAFVLLRPCDLLPALQRAANRRFG